MYDLQSSCFIDIRRHFCRKYQNVRRDFVGVSFLIAFILYVYIYIYIGCRASTEVFSTINISTKHIPPKYLRYFNYDR